MKKLWFKKAIVSAMSAIVLAVATVTVSSACTMFYYQPKTPHDMKARLMKRRSSM